MSMHRSTCWQTVGSADSPARRRVFEKPSSPRVRQRLLSETDLTSRSGELPALKLKAWNVPLRLLFNSSGRETDAPAKGQTKRNTPANTAYDSLQERCGTDALPLWIQFPFRPEPRVYFWKIVDCVATEDAAAAGVWREQSHTLWRGVLLRRPPSDKRLPVRLPDLATAAPQGATAAASVIKFNCASSRLHLSKASSPQIPVVLLASPRRIWERWQGFLGWVTSAIQNVCSCSSVVTANLDAEARLTSLGDEWRAEQQAHDTKQRHQHNLWAATLLLT